MNPNKSWTMCYLINYQWKITAPKKPLLEKHKCTRISNLKRIPQQIFLWEHPYYKRIPNVLKKEASSFFRPLTANFHSSSLMSTRYDEPDNFTSNTARKASTIIFMYYFWWHCSATWKDLRYLKNRIWLFMYYRFKIYIYIFVCTTSLLKLIFCVCFFRF